MLDVRHTSGVFSVRRVCGDGRGARQGSVRSMLRVQRRGIHPLQRVRRDDARRRVHHPLRQRRAHPRAAHARAGDSPVDSSVRRSQDPLRRGLARGPRVRPGAEPRRERLPRSIHDAKRGRDRGLLLRRCPRVVPRRARGGHDGSRAVHREDLRRPHSLDGDRQSPHGLLLRRAGRYRWFRGSRPSAGGPRPRAWRGSTRARRAGEGSSSADRGARGCPPSPRAACRTARGGSGGARGGSRCCR